MKNNNVTAQSVSDKVNKILDLLDLIIGYFLKILLILMTLLIFVQTFSRFVLNYSFSWTVEILRWSSAFLTFVGAAYSVRHNEHVGFTFLRDKGSKLVKQIFILFTNSVIIYFLIWLVIQGVAYAVGRKPVLAAASRISLFYPYLSLPIGLSITTVYYILTSLLVILGTSESLKQPSLEIKPDGTIEEVGTI